MENFLFACSFATEETAGGKKQAGRRANGAKDVCTENQRFGEESHAP